MRLVCKFNLELECLSAHELLLFNWNLIEFDRQTIVSGRDIFTSEEI